MLIFLMIDLFLLQKNEKKITFKVLLPAEVISIESFSPTVRGLTLKIDEKKRPSIFFAGQWVDFFIPNEPVVGGFSICSAPNQFRQRGTLELAVKYADHPPAKWVHEKVKRCLAVLKKRVR